MDAIKHNAFESARKMRSIILQQLNRPGMAASLAADMGTSESTISRLKNEHLDSFCALLSNMKLKVVPADAPVYDPDKIQALLKLAKDHMAQLELADLTVERHR